MITLHLRRATSGQPERLSRDSMIHTENAGFVMEPLTISRSVMRGFLQTMGWRPHDCVSMEVGEPEPWERDMSLAVARCRSMHDRSCEGPAATEVLLHTALLLDLRSAEPETMQAALPDWLRSHSPLACLLLARAHERARQTKEASDLLRQALALDKAFGPAHLELGRIQRAEGRIPQAAAAFNSWIVMRRRIAFDGRADTTDPVIVAQPNADTDIVFYANRFYVVGRGTDSVGARVIAGELFEIRDNSAFRLARRITRVPLLKRLLRDVWKRSRRLRTADAGEAGPGSRVTVLLARVRRKLLALARRSMQSAALRLFAAPIERRAETLAEAIDLANRRPAGH